LGTTRERQARYRSSETTELQDAILLETNMKYETNMRIHLQNDALSDDFKQLVEMENWNLPIDESTQFITLPTSFCKIIVTTNELIDKVVFPNLPQNYRNRQWLSARSLLAAKNYDVNTINITILNEISNDITTYQSIGTIMNRDEVVKYPTEFLDSPNLPGIPPYVLTLKLGVPFIILRNINPP